jgi:hypothetical protein
VSDSLAMLVSSEDTDVDSQRLATNAGVSDYLAQNIAHRRVERLQREGLDEHGRIHPLEEKLDGRIVPVAGKKNEPLSSRRPRPRDRPVKHFPSHPRHHHVANNEIEGVLPDLAEALDAAWDRGYLKKAGDKVIAKNLPEILAIFQEQNPLGRPRHVVPGNLNLESEDLLGLGSSRSQSHSPNR